MMQQESAIALAFRKLSQAPDPKAPYEIIYELKLNLED